MFLGLVLTPFYFYDQPLVELLDQRVPVLWLVADYLPRLVTLALILLIPVLRIIALSRETPIRVSIWRILALLFCGMAIATISRLCEVNIDPYFPDSDGIPYPVFESRALHWFDLTFGLLLVAVHEELVFRKLFLRLVEPVLGSRALTVIIGALLFGLIHWENGVGNTIAATVAGFILMFVYIRTGNLTSPITVHFVSNFFTFGVFNPFWY